MSLKWDFRDCQRNVVRIQTFLWHYSDVFKNVMKTATHHKKFLDNTEMTFLHIVIKKHHRQYHFNIVWECHKNITKTSLKHLCQQIKHLCDIFKTSLIDVIVFLSRAGQTFVLIDISPYPTTTSDFNGEHLLYLDLYHGVRIQRKQVFPIWFWH